MRAQGHMRGVIHVCVAVWVCVSACVCVCACMQGLDADLCGRLAEWEFRVGCVLLEPHATLPATHHAQALRVTLTQLVGLQAKGAQLSFRGWQWTPWVSLRVIELLSALPDMHVGLQCEQLEDALLRMSDVLGPRMCVLLVQRLSVVHDHSRKTWHFDDFEVAECSAAQLATLPRTSGSTAPHTVRILSLDIEADVLQVICAPMHA